jgi:iron-sulfur cluster repair protein YtfE (RIC family)
MEAVTVEQGEALVAELRWVHDMIRRDLAVLRELAERVRDGLAPFEVAATLDGLARNGPLWQMRMNCLRYCRFVESHHLYESHHWFPVLLRKNPALGPVIDKLNADHEVVAGHLEAVADASAALGELDAPQRRQQLVDAIEVLARDLLEHLDLEEERLNPTLRGLTDWRYLG